MTSGTEAVVVDGLPLHAVGLHEAVTAVATAAEGESALGVHLVNSYTLSLARRDERLREVLLEGPYNLIDGAPLAWLATRLAGRHVCPVRGADLFRGCLRHPALRHFLVGGADSQTAEQLLAHLGAEHADAKVVGTVVPPYPYDWERDLPHLARQVRESAANVVWVGLGTPMQDHLAAALAREVRLPVVPVGAAFDFVAGRVPEAPAYLRGSGFEWVHRLAHEPRRLWRRYLRGNADFVQLAARERARVRR